jgi:hypothetical protein
LYPHFEILGPSNIIVEGKWFKTVTTDIFSGNPVIREDPRGAFNNYSKFVFLHNLYQQPVAFFPYDPFRDATRKTYRKDMEVIDLNQEQIAQDGLF